MLPRPLIARWAALFLLTSQGVGLRSLPTALPTCSFSVSAPVRHQGPGGEACPWGVGDTKRTRHYFLEISKQWSLLPLGSTGKTFPSQLTLANRSSSLTFPCFRRTLTLIKQPQKPGDPRH